MVERPSRFQHFAAIDWSGARGERHAGIAVGVCDASGAPPKLLRAAHRWSRTEILHWLRDDLPPETLVGLDLGISLPFADRGAFFPGWPQSPPDAKALWALVDRLCADDPHMSVASFVDLPETATYFRRHGGREGALFGGGRGRFRVTERAQERLGCRPYSNFNLVGAAQVGKSSLSGMRVLHALEGALPIWPFDPLPERGSAIIEIYTTIAAIAAGRPVGRAKIRTREELDQALAALGSPPLNGSGAISDHHSDALLTAAWLRKVADDATLWNPPGLDAVRHTEGWTFGAR